jgi:hypothetical protein
MNWKMNTASIKDGEIWHMRSSVTNPYTLIDTSAGTNLIPGDDGYYNGWGDCNLRIGDNDIQVTKYVTNNFTYTVEESSLVRIRLRINERQVVNSNSYNIVSRWTIYPTGQFFRYDSIYSFSSAPASVYRGWYFDDQTYVTLSANKYKKRAIAIYSQTYPDYVGAWLSMKNDAGNQAFPFDADTVFTSAIAIRSGFDFGQATSPAKWNQGPVQSIMYLGLHHASMNAASMDSIANGVQCSRFPERRALSMITGTLDSTTVGDFSDGSIGTGDNNGDGFNEMEGAFIVGASNNTVKFVLPAHGDTCRYYPAFRIKNYTAVNPPQYVYLYKGLVAGDSVALLEGYQFNSYVNRARNELILQIDSIFCDSVGIYISADRTLAVKTSLFEAKSGNRCDTLIWRTESEHENLGFRLSRRIKPAFFDSAYTACLVKRASGMFAAGQAGICDLIKPEDTMWVKVNKELIPGAPWGTSYGPRDYWYVDRNVHNGILYEYNLIAVDYHQKEDVYGPASVMPKHITPPDFMLGPNYPNPFRDITRIRFALPVETAISLNIYTLQGRLVRKLIKPDHVLTAAYHQVTWDGKSENGQKVASGPYIYRLSSEKFVKAKVMLMAR